MTYTSRIRFLNLPLLDVSFGPRPGTNLARGTAKGWLAIGDISYGVVLSVGGIAVGGIAIGGLSCGVLSLGGLALGIWALGGAAGGWLAAGGAAIAVVGALGGFAAAGEYAVGGAAFAAKANTSAAKLLVDTNPFFAASQTLLSGSRWFLLLAAAPLIYSLVRRVRRQR